MAARKRKENWIIFVDTNIFLDFYRLGGEAADRQLKALERHQEKIITSDQVFMEFMKNRQKVINDSISKLEQPKKSSVPPIITNYDPARMLGKKVEEAIKNYDKIRKKVEKTLSDPTHHDPVYQSINRLFGRESALNLKRPNPSRYKIRSLARKRFILGYPPRKQNDTSIGDALNWEWIIACAQVSDENSHVLIVSRDGDYGLSFGNEMILNDWLRREFRERVSRKRKIELTNKLTTALKRLDEVVKMEDETLEDKLINVFNPKAGETIDEIIERFLEHERGGSTTLD